MEKRVIHLFGASGSGTSTLGRYIAERLGYYFMDTDDYFWAKTAVPFTEKREPEERVRLMLADIEGHDNAVIAGSLAKWGDALIPYFTLAVRVETDAALRLERLRARERERFGARIEPGGDMYRVHTDFMAWAASYDDGGMEIRSREYHDAWQKKLPCPVVAVDGGAGVEGNFEIVAGYV